ncbi:UNVERIFIED_CONTAM: hypothetical protein IGO34_35100 [Salmonella enterica subsp. enterica serovar Weltevreden]
MVESTWRASRAEMPSEQMKKAPVIGTEAELGEVADVLGTEIGTAPVMPMRPLSAFLG